MLISNSNTVKVAPLIGTCHVKQLRKQGQRDVASNARSQAGPSRPTHAKRCARRTGARQRRKNDDQSFPVADLETKTPGVFRRHSCTWSTAPTSHEETVLKAFCRPTPFFSAA